MPLKGNKKNMSDNRIIYVADIFDPLTTRSSTQFVNISFLNYLSNNCEKLFFVGIYDDLSNKELIKAFLTEKRINFVLVKSDCFVEKSSNFKKIFFYEKLFLKRKFFGFNLKLPSELFCFNRLIVSVPSLEAGFIGSYISNKYKIKEIISVWTDVIAYNFLDSLNDIGWKRKKLIRFESFLIKDSTKCFYLGDPQKNFQQKAYPKYSNKMFSYFIPSCFPALDTSRKNKPTLSALYFGNVNPTYRNLEQLFKSGKYINKCKIQVIGTAYTGKKPVSYENIDFVILNKRICNIDNVLEIESRGDISICFLNSKGFSLPGKLFYFTNTKRPILVIKDGKYADEIENYLKKFNRFIFCDNNYVSIANAINTITMNYENMCNVDVSEFSSKNALSFLLMD